MNFISGTNDDEFGRCLARWFETKTKTKIDVENYACTGAYENTTLKGVIIYANYTGSNFDLHVYLPKLLIRSVVREMFEYPFTRVNVLRLTARIPRYNRRVEKLLIRLGFVKEAILENYYGNDCKYDQIIYTAKKENIEKWIK